MMSKRHYKDVTSGKIKDSREIVISEAYDSDNNMLGYAVTESLINEFASGNSFEKTRIYLRGGFGVVSLDDLKTIANVCNEAVEKIEKTK